MKDTNLVRESGNMIGVPFLSPAAKTKDQEVLVKKKKPTRKVVAKDQVQKVK